jgi:hypothetical protein
MAGSLKRTFIVRDTRFSKSFSLTEVSLLYIAWRLVDLLRSGLFPNKYGDFDRCSTKSSTHFLIRCLFTRTLRWKIDQIQD